ALSSPHAAADAGLRPPFPQSLHSELPHPQTLRNRAPINIPDTQTDLRVPEAVRANARARGYRSWITVPLLRYDEAVGTISVTRRDPGGFPDDEIALLGTFAGPAVVAIGNVRRLTEPQARNRELTEALEQQTATAEVLKVISRSTFELQPVLDTLIENAARLCSAERGCVYRFDGEVLRMEAEYGTSPEFKEFWKHAQLRPGRGSAAGRVVLERRIVHIPDVMADPEYELTSHTFAA